MTYPSYLELYRDSKLARLAEKTFQMLSSCTLCPRKCKVNRLKNQAGFCKTGLKARVCSFMPHHGEEPPVSGTNGSGTIFFSGCNMACAYCQNYQFSQLGEGREVEAGELAGFMLELQKMGCHNINLVSPTHVLPQILEALVLAIPAGLKIPLVYNTGGYELAEIIRLLEGIIDIYLPDMRYSEEKMAIKYSQAPGYPQFNRKAVKEMHRQTGVARIDKDGLIKRGLIIRHLVLPENIPGTDKTMRFIAEELSKDSYISLMSQYLPCYKSMEYPEISRRITEEEYLQAQRSMSESGLENGWTQSGHGLERFAGVHIKPALGDYENK